MFGLFKKKDPTESLKKKYQKLMEESYKVSHSDRKRADALAAEAEEVMKEIEALKQGH
jgi:hypothetical protein